MAFHSGRAIALVDCDSFFASCEQLLNPMLIGKPVCVMSNNDGCIVARSKEAKELGVKMGMPVFQARKIHPNVIYISGRLDIYGEISNRVMEVLRHFSPTIEVYSIDEAFIDLTGLRKVYRKNYLKIAEDIKNEVKHQVGVPVSVGVSLSKVLAKLATERAKKNNGYYIIGFRGITEELKNTELIDIWGLGSNTVALLNKYGIYTAYELTLQHDFWIKKLLGKKGLEIKHELSGESIYPVIDFVEMPKSIQKTSSFAQFTSDKEYIKSSLNYHVHRACKKLRKLDIKTQLVGAMLRTKDFKVYTTNKVLIYPTNWEFEIFNVVSQMFEELYCPGIIYRSSGVFLSNLSSSNEQQLSIFEDCKERTKKENLSKTLDCLELKYGQNVIKPARNIDSSKQLQTNSTSIVKLKSNS